MNVPVLPIPALKIKKKNIKYQMKIIILLGAYIFASIWTLQPIMFKSTHRCHYFREVPTKWEKLPTLNIKLADHLVRGRCLLTSLHTNIWFFHEHKMQLFRIRIDIKTNLQCTVMGPAPWIDSCLAFISCRKFNTHPGSCGTPWSGHTLKW